MFCEKNTETNMDKNIANYFNSLKYNSKKLLQKVCIIIQKIYKNIIIFTNKIKAASIKAAKRAIKDKEKFINYKVLIGKKYFSKNLSPNFLKNKKTSGLPAFFWYISALAVAVFLIISSFTAIIVDVFVENKHLKENISALNKVNEKQRDLLLQKNNEIKVLKQKESEIDSKVQEFVDRYKALTESIIQGGLIDAPVSRSGDSLESSRSSLLEELNQLKSIINGINDLSGTQDNTKTNIENELSEAEQKFYSYLETIPTLWPVRGKITSYFGDREHPIWNTTRLHQGIDISAGYGHDIVAAGDGEVVLSSYYNQYGYTIIIDHGGGISTLYAHCSSLIAANGQTVKKGEVIAKVGSTGLSTGNHLHFEVRVNGVPVDPLNFLSQ